MLFHSSRGIGVCLSIVLFVFSARAQTPETVLASVDGVSITQQQVDKSIAARIYPLQQQLYAIRKSALENHIVSRLLEVEAKARGMPVEELRRQLTQGEISVTQ